MKSDEELLQRHFNRLNTWNKKERVRKKQKERNRERGKARQEKRTREAGQKRKEKKQAKEKW